MSEIPTSDVNDGQELSQTIARIDAAMGHGGGEVNHFADATTSGSVDTISASTFEGAASGVFGQASTFGLAPDIAFVARPIGDVLEHKSLTHASGSVAGLEAPDAIHASTSHGSGPAQVSVGVASLDNRLESSGSIAVGVSNDASTPGSFAASDPAAAAGPTTIMVGTEAQLNQAIATVDGATSPGDYVIQLTGSITENTDTGASSTFDGSMIADPGQLFAFNLASGVNVTIDGQGNALSGAGVDPGLIVYAGNVTVENLAIDNTVATGGAGGDGGGGGGAGLGGGLFVASGGTVTADGVTFSSDAATGGAGGAAYDGQGGGGGLGGDGGEAGGGGGGVGLTASGGSNYEGNGGTGIILSAAGGGSGLDGGSGGAYGGGGGSSLYGSGGGGVGGSGDGNTAYGGFGGGGGNTFSTDNGGFGGGGAAGGTGGFGGGGGGAFAESGGFGGGTGGLENGANGGGGGGLGAGADVFVQQGGTLTLSSGTLGAGTVTGGASGGDGATAGNDFGTGLFLQGDETVTLGSSGQPLTIDGTIADQTGNGGTGGNAGAGALDIASGSTVTLAAADSYTGGTTLESGSTLVLGNGQAAGTGAITFGGTGGDLVLDAVVPSAIYGFGAPNAIDLADIPIADYITDAYTFSTDDLQILESDGTVINLDVHGITASNFPDIHVVSDGHGGTLIEAPCFALGTSLDTPNGSIRVEDLQVSDTVMTLSGPARVVWIGHRRATDVGVIRILPHALDENQPRRDLYVSDDHAMLLDGVLVPAGLLVNGTSIVAERWERVVFFHVELDAHAILLAEGAPAESYIDTGNRRQFGNCPMSYDPISATQDHCAELVVAGERLERIRSKLALVLA